MILITGGAGYIGAHCNKELAKRGCDTVVFDNLVYGHRAFARWGQFVLGDLGDAAQLRLCFEKFPIDTVMHFGGYAYVGESVSDPAKYYRNNLIHTIRLLDAMRAAGAKQFIFSSTCSTYGVPERLPLTEDHPQAPINPYGRTKLMIEQVLRDYEAAYGIRHVNLRYFNAAGADPDAEIGEDHDPETHLIPLVLDAALGCRPDVKIFGTDYPTPDGTCIRDYIHVTDLADAHLLAMEYLKSGRPSDSFNLGNGNGFSVREVIDCAREVTGRPVPAVETPRRPGDPPSLVGSAQKARDILGWRPRFADLTAIVATAWRWHQKLRG